MYSFSSAYYLTLAKCFCHFGTHSSFTTTIKTDKMAISIPILLMMKQAHCGFTVCTRSSYLN